jgi:hypothetical protein
MAVIRQILTANQQVASRKAGSYKKVVESVFKSQWGPGAKIDWNPKGKPIKAFINHGNWMATCDDCPAPSTLFAEPGLPFFCTNCQNVMNGGQARPVEFPENRNEIEAVLLARDFPQNRNWLPGETIEELKTENRAHGVEGDQ